MNPKPFELPDCLLPRTPEVCRLLGYPAEALIEGEVARLMGRQLTAARRLLAPWVGLLPVALEVGGAPAPRVALAGGQAVFESAALAELLEDCEQGVVTLVTAGAALDAEVDALQQAGLAAEAVILDAIGSAAVEALQREIGKQLCREWEPRGFHVTRHYSPGYTGWALEDQAALFRVLRQGLESLPVTLNDYAMMLPRKSLSALWGVARLPLEGARAAGRVACRSCNLADCTYRRAPYAAPSAQGRADQLNGIETMEPQSDNAVNRIPATASGNGTGAPAEAPAPLRLEPVNYAMAAKALGKWTRQNLECEARADGALHFRFRYLGSTCSSGGIPIDAVLHAVVRPGEAGVVIETAWIEIPESDFGLQSMCEYTSRRQAFVDELAKPPAFCGQTLEQVLGKDGAINPAGCFCRAPQVNHKWRMVLSTIHFALTQQAREQESQARAGEAGAG